MLNLLIFLGRQPSAHKEFYDKLILYAIFIVGYFQFGRKVYQLILACVILLFQLADSFVDACEFG